MDSVVPSDLAATIDRLTRRYERERQARLSAETIAERSLRDLYDKTEQLELIGTVAISANQCRSVDEAFQIALTKICETVRWPLGHAYLCRSGPDGRCAQSTNVWHSAAEQTFENFQTATKALHFESGVGLPGRVLATGKPAWIADIASDNNFLRADAAAQSGLRSGFGFPVLVGNEVVAVLEFYNTVRTCADDALLRLMEQIGAQLGRVVERTRAEERLIHDASHDPLTGLPNRALFLDRLTRAIHLKQRRDSSNYAVLFVDLDRFKIVNDSLGHSAGDDLIKLVAARLLEKLRASDLVIRRYPENNDSNDLLARMGGDEFTVLLEDISDLKDTLLVAERLLEALRVPFRLAGQDVHISASIGVAWGGTGYVSASEALRDADLAMYRAKEQGKARCEVFDAQFYHEAKARLELEGNLRKAVEMNEFVLHYQPIVSLETGQVTGFEALVRWQKDGKLLFPDAFISTAEDTGLIIPIGAWVLREACRTLRFLQESPAGQTLTMSVNLSARQFTHRALVSEIQAIVGECGLEATTLRLEVTESVMMADVERSANVLRDLRSLGFQISLDDFGTGYSSLSYLHKLPFQILKIDKSFIGRMCRDSESLAIVKTIISLAEGLGMSVVAEGTESLEHVAILMAFRCGQAQGYFYAKPMPREEAAKYLLEHRELAHMPCVTPKLASEISLCGV